MAEFDPDKYLQEPFDPDAYLGGKPAAAKSEPTEMLPMDEVSMQFGRAAPTPQASTMPYQKQIGRAAEAFRALGRGAVKGAVGLPGELEALGAYTLPETIGRLAPGLARKMPERFGVTPPEQRVEVFPRAATVGKMLEGLGAGRTPERAKGFEEAGELAGGFVSYGPRAAEKVAGAAETVGKAGEVVRRARGTEARQAAEALRGTTTELAGEIKAAQEAAAATAAREVDRLQAISTQIAEREAIAAERAAARAGVPPEAMADIRQAALTAHRERVRAAEREAIKAGATRDEALAAVVDAERTLIKANDEIAALERRLLSGERMTPEEFGGMVANAAKKLADDALREREKIAGFGKAVESAGPQLRVNTQGIHFYIDNALKSVKDPQIRNTLLTIKSELTNVIDEKAVKALNIAQADSARKMLNRIMRTKQIQFANGTTGDAADAMRYVGQINNMLRDVAAASYKPYGQALEKFAELSRPLDIVQRKGPLRKVVDIDNLSQDLLRGSAEVAGIVIREARNGKPVFTRLLEINPEIQNGARAYFHRELFAGKDKVPNADDLRKFLQRNEGVLQQLKLYDEFSTVANARSAGEKALKNVEDELKVAKRTAAETEVELKRALGLVKQAESLRGGARERVAAAEKAAVPVERVAAEPAKAAAERAKEVTKEIGAAEKVGAAATERARNLETRLIELSNEDLKTVAGKAEAILKDLVARRDITPQQYDNLLQQVRMVENAYGQTAEARKTLVKLLGGLGAAGVIGISGRPD